jgi:hypothetical protein
MATDTIREMAEALVAEGYDKDTMLEMGDCADSLDEDETAAYQLALSLMGFDK